MRRGPTPGCEARSTMSRLVREAGSGNGGGWVSELHGCPEASDPTRMANTRESSSEPSSLLRGLRQLLASAKTATQSVNTIGQCVAVPQRLSGERWSLNGESMRSGERGNPDHPPDQQHRAGRPTAREVDGCGEWEDARSEGSPLIGGIPVETSRAGDNPG